MAMPPAPAPLGNNKTYAAALAGAVTVVASWAIVTFTHVTLPPEVVAAVQTILTIGGVYFTPHGG